MKRALAWLKLLLPLIIAIVIAWILWGIGAAVFTLLVSLVMLTYGVILSIISVVFISLRETFTEIMRRMH